jgi:eukaryotic-like serine/threonine-protein kinase
MPGSSPAAEIRPALLVGRYQMLERSGEGGMGVVWRAYDVDLEEQVAIKFLREEFAKDEVLRAWFRREVKLARRVTHPNVARVFEFGRDKDRYFLTMEFVAGESLKAALDHGRRLSPAQASTFAIGLCQGLAAAHAAGVVHGDIKPANILLAPTRGAVLTDFGVARALSEAHLPEESFGGTPIYMAPEQIMEGALTFRGDVYSVGVVLLEALTGYLPWPDDSLGALLDAKCTGEDPRLSELMPELPRPWCDVLMHCLRSDPAERPADARALLSLLSQVPGG